MYLHIYIYVYINIYVYLKIIMHPSLINTCQMVACHETTMCFIKQPGGSTRLAQLQPIRAIPMALWPVDTAPGMEPGTLKHPCSW